MKRKLRPIYRVLRWWNEMVRDLLTTEQHVQNVAAKLHSIAGRAHVLEMEAYGHTKPRQTRLPQP